MLLWIAVCAWTTYLEPAEGARPMSRFDIGIWMFVASLVLIALRMPVAVAMLLVGGVGLCGDQRRRRRCSTR